ncbi:MAG: universal stress protein [Anaerolineae bacterium]|nr:universal stress protein [Anaerolineae bacterium]
MMDNAASTQEAVSPVEPQTPFRRILVPVDGSEASIEASRTAVRVAAVHQLPVTALYVVDDTIVTELTAVSGQPQGAVRRQLEAKGWRYLEHIAEIANECGVSCERVMRRGMSHIQIANLVRELDIDLVVIGETRLPNARRAFSGSLTERVIDYVSCSVLVIR